MNASKIEDVSIVREGYSDAGTWSVASLTQNGRACLAIRWNKQVPESSGSNAEWFILPEQFVRPVLDAAQRWDPEAEEAIRRGYEEQAAYEASTNDPYPYDYEFPAELKGEAA